jgi:D-alanyl-D-alanine carboxypeptidase (penicillin-binding protein 5/6)
MKTSSRLTGTALLLGLSLLLPAMLTAKPKPHPKAHAAVPAASKNEGTAVAGVTETPGVPNPPDVYAKAYILIDYTSGQVLAQHDADARMEPASLTKLMTCYVVFHALKAGTLKLQEPITISEHAWRAEGSRTFLQVGSQVPAEILIKGMIVQSGNDASIALAERIGGTEPAFVQMMNDDARQLGMSNTHFDDSTGLPSPTHYSSARDLSRLAAALVRDFPEYYTWFSVKEFIWNNIKQDNRNGLLERDPTVDGLKTGHTDSAGYCLVTSAKRDTMRLIGVVLNSPSVKGREDASAALLNYGFTFYQTVTVKQKDSVVLKPRVFKGAEEYFTVGPATDVVMTLPRNEVGSIQTSATAQRRLVAPINRTTPVGELQIVVDNKPVKSVPLFPLADVPAGGIWSRLSDTVVLWFQK